MTMKRSSQARKIERRPVIPPRANAAEASDKAGIFAMNPTSQMIKKTLLQTEMMLETICWRKKFVFMKLWPVMMSNAGGCP